MNHLLLDSTIDEFMNSLYYRNDLDGFDPETPEDRLADVITQAADYLIEELGAFGPAVDAVNMMAAISQALIENPWQHPAEAVTREIDPYDGGEE